MSRIIAALLGHGPSGAKARFTWAEVLAWITKEYVDGLTTTDTPSFAGVITNSGGIVVDANTAITLADATHNGKVLVCTNAVGVTVTVPAGLPVGFTCLVIQAGAGTVSFGTSGGATLQGYGGADEIVGQHASATIVSTSTDVFNLSGNIT